MSKSTTYNQQEYIATFAESMNSQVQWMHSWKCTINVYSVEILIWIVCFNNYRAEQNYQTLYFQLADI